MARSSTSGLGRPPGVPNKATAEVKLFAQQYTEAAIRRLAELGGLVEGISGADSHQAQVSACNAILDRAHGKPAQAVEHSGTITTLSSLVEASMSQSDAVPASKTSVH